MKYIFKAFFNFIRDLFETFMLAFLMFIAIYLFVAQFFKVTGSSMLPQFHDGEYLITEKVSFYFSKPKRGDVLVLKCPNWSQEACIKRIVGLPGETVEIKNGEVYVYNNEHPEGFILNEAYLADRITTKVRGATTESQEFEIPEGKYFVMGDNRDASLDSRIWGPISENAVIGRSWFRYWPPQALGLTK